MARPARKSKKAHGKPARKPATAKPQGRSRRGVTASIAEAGSWSGSPAGAKAIDELEARLAAAAADDDAPWAVYADWLQAQGEPWGEVIALALAKRPQAQARIEELEETLFVGLVNQVGWE